jgi:hypothetical protein
MMRPWLGVETDDLATNGIVKWSSALYDFHVWCHGSIVIADVLGTNEIVKWNRVYSGLARVCAGPLLQHALECACLAQLLWAMHVSASAGFRGSGEAGELHGRGAIGRVAGCGIGLMLRQGGPTKLFNTWVRKHAPGMTSMEAV